MASFSQHHMDGLELHLSPLQYFHRQFVNEADEKLRSHLSNFGISGELALQAMYTLSGGQKSRVAFAKVRACLHLMSRLTRCLAANKHLSNEPLQIPLGWRSSTWQHISQVNNAVMQIIVYGAGHIQAPTGHAA